MTMSSSIDLVTNSSSKSSGWFDSLRRAKQNGAKPSRTLRVPASPLSAAKSLSSLNAHAVHGEVATTTPAPTLGHARSVGHGINSSCSVVAHKPPKPPTTQQQKKSIWSSMFSLNKSSSPKAPDAPPRADSLPARTTLAATPTHHFKKHSVDQLGFLTLPRKARLPQSTSMGAVCGPAATMTMTTPRHRSYSTVVFGDGQRKRSTVWYTLPESNVLNKKSQLKDEIAEVTAEMESMDNGEESKNAARAKQLSLGRKKFNMDPKKGIEFLVQQGLLQNTPQDIAAFLYRGEGLNKTAIGDYLGEKSPFHEQVLKAFVDLHDFTDLILVQALRQFLWSFRLPGEAQKIDRMMETFAQRYCQLNPNIFSNPDTCYVLSFAVIILNTSLHNPSVKEKPTLEKFIAMNRGINDGKDLPRDILESLYESIKAEPFKIPEDDGNDLMHTFFNPDREGWLWKQGGRYKSWKRRWFILNDNCLYYFEYTTDKEPRGIIPLENIQVREVVDRHKPNCFELYATGGNEFIKACKTDSEGKVVEGKHTVYRMSAAEQSEKDEWIACIRQSISHNPFYDMLAARKKKAQKSSHRTKP